LTGKPPTDGVQQMIGRSEVANLTDRQALRLEQVGAGGAALGDPGHVKVSLTCDGLTDALRDAELLANALTSPRSRTWPRRRLISPLPGPPSRRGRSGQLEGTRPATT